MEGNLFDGLVPVAGMDEQVEDLLQSGPMRVKRIVSTGQASPTGFRYDQGFRACPLPKDGGGGR